MNMSSRPKVGAHVRNTKTNATGYVAGFADFGKTVVVGPDEGEINRTLNWELFDIEVIK